MAVNKQYAKRLRANVTSAQNAAIQREAALAGVTPSDVVRAALDAYFESREARDAS